MKRRRVRLSAIGFVSIALWSAGPLRTTVNADVTRFVSDMNPVSNVNGWGPFERDRSNGDTGAADGGTLRVAGVAYAKGLGVHAYSEIRYQIGGACSQFNAVVGLDDEVGANGSVVFAVYGDGSPLYSSPVLTGSSQGVPVSVSVTGFNELRLVVTDAGDNPYYDHADWADAKLTCASAPGNQFAPPVSLSALVNAHSVRSVDLNGDGRLDLVAANAGSNAASVWLGNGNATFGERMDFPTGPMPKSIAIGELNGDGRYDLVSANQNGASVSVLLRNPGGGFGFGGPVDYPACAGTHETAIGDFTRDGINDLIVACWGGSVVSFLRGIGNGTFAPKVDYTVGAAPTSVVARDLNGDGLVDAAVANSNDASISVLTGRGDGTFNPHVRYPVGSSPWGIQVGDVNGDGRLDLAVSNDGSDTISVLRGAANGTFMAAVHYPTGDGPKGVAIADINGDGLADLLSANTAGNYPNCCTPGGDTISLLLNVGNGTFAAPQTYTVGTTAFGVWAADFDGDGDLDVATANWHSNDVTILRNDGQPGAYLSDLSWTYMSNGWGPAERDRSNGDFGANDGGPISLDGVTYPKGLGVHADSDVRWLLNGQCSTFSAVIGIDDWTSSNGSVYFQVWVDGTLRFMSGLMTGSTPAQRIQVDISGGNELALAVHYGWDNYFYDHADWADARIVCTP